MSQTKRNALLFLFIAGVFTIILAMSLPNLVIPASHPFSPDQIKPKPLDPDDTLSNNDSSIWFLQSLVALGLVLGTVFFMHSLLTAERKWLVIVNAMLILALLGIAYYLQDYLFIQHEQQQVTGHSTDMIIDKGVEESSASLTLTTPPAWLTLIVMLATLTLLGAFAFFLIRSFQRQTEMPDTVLEKLAQEVQNTIEALHAGDDFSAAIIRCYQEMSRVIREEKGINREMAMTAREFEDRLVEKGLPPASIKTLTGLFEQARYGSLPASTHEENIAVSCLATIAAACQRDSYAG